MQFVAPDSSQKYKEDKCILEKVRLGARLASLESALRVLRVRGS